MALFKCKMCGGDLNLAEGKTVAECEYCGSVQTVPSADDEKKLALFARANRLRAACEFDKASGLYEAITADFPQEAEAYWGLVLCKYGIEYVDDPSTGKKIPTCHRSSFDSVMDDNNFEQALENADSFARRIYRDEAKQIEDLRKNIVAVSNNEEPYDIFICYKETTEQGDRTLDSVLAQDIYNSLIEKGYRVFFSRITLEDKLGMEYEPYIFAALNSAKIMLAVGTDYEYYNAVWVKNEWGRYLKLMEKDKSKHLIPCYKGIDAYDLPKEFSKLQAQDMGKMGAVQDILRGVEKLLPNTSLKADTTPSAKGSSDNGISTLLKRVSIFLEDENWNSADEYAEKVLDIDPENAQAYLGKLMAELHISKAQQLSDVDAAINENINFQKALRYADEDLKKQLSEYLASVVARKKAALQAIKEKVATAIKAGTMVSAGSGHTVALKYDGSAISTRHHNKGQEDAGRCNISNWRDMSAVSAGFSHTVGLKTDGTVIATKYLGNPYFYPGACDVSSWKNIIAVSAGWSHTVGLKADGTVVSTKYTRDREYYCGQCGVIGWTDIVAISAGESHTVGLKSDGTVVATPFLGKPKDYTGQCEVSDWTNIVAISAGRWHTAGLKADGTVITTPIIGNHQFGQDSVQEWHDIIAICAGGRHTIGLKADGTVVATESYCDMYAGECDVASWRNIVAISAGFCHTVGLRSDGTVVSTKVTDDFVQKGQDEVYGWKLFKNFATLDQEVAQARLEAEEKAERERQEAARRAEEERQRAALRAEEERKHKLQRCQELQDEQKALQEELATLTGFFSGLRRKKVTERLDEIKDELKSLR